jgi:hypothetical protein
MRHQMDKKLIRAPILVNIAYILQLSAKVYSSVMIIGSGFRGSKTKRE